MEEVVVHIDRIHIGKHIVDGILPTKEPEIGVQQDEQTLKQGGVERHEVPVEHDSGIALLKSIESVVEKLSENIQNCRYDGAEGYEGVDRQNKGYYVLPVVVVHPKFILVL